MKESALYESLFQLFKGIELCIDAKLQLPALSLIYSGIDTAGWLASASGSTVRSSFTTWVDTYLMPAKPIPCSAIDLYAARCGILHTLTPDSDLWKQGQARRICYAWGNAKAADLQAALVSLNRNEIVLHIDDLSEAFRLGAASFFDCAEQDAVIAAQLESKSGRFFSALTKI